MIADLAGSTTTPIMWDTPNRELSYAGRWLSPDSYGLGAFDPSNSRNWNRYAYALNDPLRNIEPSGLDCITANEDGSFSEEGGDCPDVDPDNEYYLNCDGCLDNVTGGYRDSSGNLVLTNGDDSVAGVVGGGGDLTDGFGYSSTPGGTAFFGQGSGGPDFVQLQVSLGAPNNGTPWYKSCTAQALLKGAGTTALDAIGILPEGGTVSAAFSLFHGAAGVSNGIKIQQRAAFAAGIISTAAAGSDLQGPQESTLSTTVTGLQATVGGFGIAKGLIEDIPVAGQAIAIGATALDLVSTGLAVAKCY